MSYSPQLLPTPRQSPGLIDAYTDIIGGDYVQANVAGNQSNLNFNGLQAQFSVVSGGPTGKQVVIPSQWYGGNITWIRGVYALSATPRYNDFMADFNAGDTTNYADFTRVATNNYSAGVLSTSVPVLASVALGTTLQAYYSYRTSVQTAKGQAMSGWPMLHVDPYQGTANDGDDYMMHALYHASRCTGDSKYRALADKIGNALLAAGSWLSNDVTFNIPFDAEAGQYGIYWYNTGTAIISVSVNNSALVVSATVPSGSSSGVGLWPTFPVSAISPFNSFDFTIYGDGSTRNLSLSTSAGATAVGVLVPLFSANTNKFVSFSYKQKDFWQTGNVVYDAKHADYAYATPYGSNAYSIVNYEDTVNGYIIRQFTWNFAGNASGSAGYTFGVPASSSVGTTALNFDIYVSSAGNYTVTAKDNTGTKYAVTLALAQGWNTGKSIPWTTFSAGFVHPVQQFWIDVPTAITAGVLSLNNCRYDAVTSLDKMSYTSLGGIQFQFPSSATAYSVSFQNWTVNQTPIDGPTSDPVRYEGIPRWTYKWVQVGNTTGYGSWRGPSGCGYMWLGGWYSSAISNPNNNRVVSSEMLNFLTDSQNAYATQFPAQTKGPFINLYGRTSWEAITTSGYVANVLQSSTLNQWYFDSTSDWYGYNYRALLSVAQYYFLTASAQAKAILDNWLAWIPSAITSTAPAHVQGSGVVPTSSSTSSPYTFGTNPTVGNVLVLCLATYDTGTITTGVSDNFGNTWTKQATKQSSATTVEIWTAPVTTTGASFTVTATFSPTGGNCFTVDEFSGISIPVSVDINAYAIDTTSTDTSITVTPGGITTAANEVVISALGLSNGTNALNITQPSGWTSMGIENSGSTYEGQASAYLILTSVQSAPSATWTHATGSSNAVALEISLKGGGSGWNVPSGFNKDGTLSYAGYSPFGPVYGFAVIAAACMYKYFVDGDTVAQTWYRRLLDTMYANYRQTATGSLAGIYPQAEGTGYTTATVNFTVNAGAVAPVATAFIAGGKITHYVVTSAGSGITSISMNITGDGSGAVGNPYLTDKLVGAFSSEHTGWEASEIYNTYALLINGPPPGGHINHTLLPGPNDLTAFTGLYQFYVNNTGDTRPSMRTSALMPVHEYDVGSWHWNAAIENPMVRDTHVKGAMWTETIAPSLYMAVEYYRYSGDKTWIDTLYNLLLEFTGGSAPPTSNYFVPNSVSGESQIWEGQTQFMHGRKK